MPSCPKCQSTFVARSRSRNRWERWRKGITRKRLHRCRACGWRGWMLANPFDGDVTGIRDQSLAPDPPNLAGTLLARPNARREIDLTALDRLTSQPEEIDS